MTQMLICQDITTYLVLEVFPTLKFEELCTGIGIPPLLAFLVSAGLCLNEL
jgi:hypothetical protein